MRLRLLPIVIIVAGLAISTRLGSLWVDLTAHAQADKGQAATSQSTGEAPETRAEPQAAAVPTPMATPMASPAATDTAGDGDEFAPVEMAASTEDEDQAATADFQKSALSPDPFALTDEDIDLLQELAQRREELGQRERQLDQREALLAAAEARLNQKISALEALKEEIEVLLREQQGRNDEQIASLVRIYESMKPKQAARIMQDLDLDVVIAVIEGMKERKSATILAQMDAKRARMITVELATRNELPIPKE